MNKRKGFTLIELVGVLVIITIIVLISVPLVMNIIRKAKETSRRRSVDNYGKAVEQAIMSYMMDNGQTPTDLDSLQVEYSGNTVVCNTKKINENGSLYMSQCSVNGKEVLDSSTEDGYYHYNKRKFSNIEYVNMYGDALEKASLAYYNNNKTPVTDYKTLTIDYKGDKEVNCNVRVNPDGTIYMTSCTVAGESVEDTEEEDGYYHYGNITYSMVEVLKYKKNPITTIYQSDVTNVHEMYEFNHEETVQTPALTDYRYIGSDPYNYVEFNNGENWRIIGVFAVADGSGNYEERVKLIRDESLGGKQWDSNNLNEWVGSTMQIYLNEEYTIDNNSKGMIDIVKWYLGGKPNPASGSEMYESERSESTYSIDRSKNWTGNIGLMYPSDYIYTYALGVDNTCYNNPGSCSNGNPLSGWLYRNYHNWLLNSRSANTPIVFFIHSSGYVGTIAANFGADIRPTLYLKPNVRIKSGDGTIINPYQLEI